MTQTSKDDVISAKDPGSEPPFAEMALNFRRVIASARAVRSSEIVHAWNTPEQGDVVLTIANLIEAAKLLDRAKKVYALAERAAAEHDGLMGAEWVRDVLAGVRDA